MLHSKYLERCLQLAELGSGSVAPNPMVGAMLVNERTIIGEGYHHEFGKAHAEVNAFQNAIDRNNESLISSSILYVSLEPCNHFGKTPPCTDLIIRHKIKEVVVGCRDPFHVSNEGGIEKLMRHGVNVVTGIMEKECIEMNRRFMTFHLKRRPYVLLKFAQSADQFIAPLTGNKKISNEYSDILVHKWRSEESAIMIGTKTAENDNPLLTVRKWPGKNPLRIVVDKNLRLDKNLRVFDNSANTLVFNSSLDSLEGTVEYIKIEFGNEMVEEILSKLFEKNILSVMIEGGTNLLNQFIEKKLWDEARIITANKIFAEGLRAPKLNGILDSETKATGDRITTIKSNYE